MSDKLEKENLIEPFYKSSAILDEKKENAETVPAKKLLLKKLFGFIYLNIFFRGMIIGLSELVPGISAGTIAFATGIYDQLLYNINQINLRLIKAILRLDLNFIYKALDWKFLISLMLGAVVSVMSFSRIVAFCLLDPRLNFLIYSTIFGLVLGATIFLLRKIKNGNIYHFFLLSLAMLISYYFTSFLTFSSSSQTSCHIFDPVLIFSAIIAISMAMLPGISGSFILLVLGQYHKVIKAIASFTTGFDLLAFSTLLNLGIGVFLGVLFFSKAITFLLKKHHTATLSFLSGLMIGSLHIIWPFKNHLSGTFILGSVYFYLSLILIVFAFFIVLFLQKNEDSRKKI